MQGRIENKIKVEEKIKNKITTMPEYVKRYYFYLNQKSHTTKLNYMNKLLRFLEYLEIEGISIELNDLDKIDAYIIEQYIASISYYESNNKTKELSNTSKANIYSALNSFFTFLCANDYIRSNPFDNKKITRPKADQTSITFLTPEEVKEIQERILHGWGSSEAKAKQCEWKYRDFLLFRIPVVTGLRVEALAEINVSDVDLVRKTIRVTEKGNITKDIYIDELTRDYLLRWIMQRADFIGNGNYDCQALFVSNRLKRMDVRTIEKNIMKYADGINGKHITPHKLRSTCGTNLYQAKKDIYLVASVLGHSSTEPTRRYTKVFDTDKRDAINTIANMY